MPTKRKVGTRNARVSSRGRHTKKSGTRKATMTGGTWPKWLGGAPPKPKMSNAAKARMAELHKLKHGNSTTTNNSNIGWQKAKSIYASRLKQQISHPYMDETKRSLIGTAAALLPAGLLGRRDLKSMLPSIAKVTAGRYREAKRELKKIAAEKKQIRKTGYTAEEELKRDKNIVQSEVLKQSNNISSPEEMEAAFRLTSEGRASQVPEQQQKQSTGAENPMFNLASMQPVYGPSSPAGNPSNTAVAEMRRRERESAAAQATSSQAGQQVVGNSMYNPNTVPSGWVPPGMY